METIKARWRNLPKGKRRMAIFVVAILVLAVLAAIGGG